VRPYKYGLLSATEPVTDPGLRWELGIQWETDFCADGGIWEVACGPVFTVTLTRTATPGQVSVAISPAGSYTTSLDGAAPVAAGATLTVGAGAHTVAVAEAAGLQRSVTLNVDGSAAEGTVYTATSTQTANAPKAFDDVAPLGVADPFEIYAGLDCSIVGDIDDERKARRLENAQQRLIEERFWAKQLVNNGATEVTTAAVDLVTAIGLLEKALAANAAGIGVLHAPRETSSHAALNMQTVQQTAPDQLTTVLETVWAFGGGYQNTTPTGEPAEDGEVWIYATGPVTVRLGEIQPKTTRGDELSRITNKRFALAERSVLVARECPLFVAQVNLGA